MGEINREDMLELTRRMNVKRNCFSRIAGAYMDREGLVDGTFNVHFLKLSPKEQQKNMNIAKAVLLGKTNEQLKDYPLKKEDGKMWKFLTSLKECGLKNDGILDIFYEILGENYKAEGDYGVYFFFGIYDVKKKAEDKENLWESEETYSFLIGSICPVHGDYEPGKPEWGFLFPAFKDRSSDEERIHIFQADENNPNMELLNGILLS